MKATRTCATAVRFQKWRAHDSVRGDLPDLKADLLTLGTLEAETRLENA
jgi:hypothetical protein